MTEQINFGDSELSQDSIRDAFVGAIQPGRSEQERQLDESMRRARLLGKGFAEAMVDLQMPIDRFTLTLTDPASKKPVALRTYPAWVVLKDTNLTGNSLARAQVGHETHSVSLLSGTPNNFRTNWETVTRDQLEKLDDRFDKLTYYETAVAVTPQGQWLPLAKSFFYRKYGGGIKSAWRWEQFMVHDRGVDAKDFYDTEKNLSPDKSIELLRTRLLDAQKDYEKKRREQIRRKSLEAPDYEISEQPVIIPGKTANKHQGFWSRILGNAG